MALPDHCLQSHPDLRVRGLKCRNYGDEYVIDVVASGSSGARIEMPLSRDLKLRSWSRTRIFGCADWNVQDPYITGVDGNGRTRIFGCADWNCLSSFASSPTKIVAPGSSGARIEILASYFQRSSQWSRIQIFGCVDWNPRDGVTDSYVGVASGSSGAWIEIPSWVSAICNASCRTRIIGCVDWNGYDAWGATVAIKSHPDHRVRGLKSSSIEPSFQLMPCRIRIIGCVDWNTTPLLVSGGRYKSHPDLWVRVLEWMLLSMQ